MKKPALKSLKKKAWGLCSEYIRKRNSDASGLVKCVTCGKVMPWKEAQAGHFIDGRGNSILFDERGIFPQCVGCNIFKNGNKVEYTKYMIDNFGRELVDELCYKSRKPFKFTVEYLETLISDYETKIKVLGVI